MATKYDLQTPEDVRSIHKQLDEIHTKLVEMLRDGPNELPEPLVVYTTPSPRGMSDLPRAIYHINELQSVLVSGYPGLR